MKMILNGKTYNTDTMTILVEQSRYSGGNNYCGSDSIRVTVKGTYAFVFTSNGEDLYRCDYIEAIDKAEISAKIDGWDIDDDQCATLLERGIVTEA